MKFRQISIVLGLLILVVAVFITWGLIFSGQEKQAKEKPTLSQAVKVKTVKLDSIPATVPVSGQLEARERVEIFAEVQGRFIQGNKPFKAGNAYDKGDVLIQIDNREASLNLQAQKSNLMNSIAQMLPDLKIDYPDHYSKWQQYLKNLEVDEPLAPLPKVNNQQVKYFVTSRSIYNQYYSIQSQQERLSKYTIRAPFDGVVTESMIDPGTLVRPGQELGQFINPNGFELGVAVGNAEFSLVNIGDSVNLWSEDIPVDTKGEVIRVNQRVNPGTQSAEVFIGTQGKGLQEGMFLEGEIYTGMVKNAFRIPRKFLESNQQVWIVKDGKLQKASVQVSHKTNDIAIVKGLEAGTKVLFEAMPNAYSGMSVKPVESGESL